MLVKNYLAICLCLLLSHDLHAQLRVGVKGGLNLNRSIGGFRNNAMPQFDIDRYDLHIDPHIGLTADIPVTKRFHIRPDLLFSRRVAEYEKTDGTEGIHFSQKFKADYIELPVQFVYYRQFGHLGLYLGGGPYIGLALSGEAENSVIRTDGSGGPISYFFTREENWYRKTSLGAVLAAGVDLPFGLTGELSLHRAFHDVNNPQHVNKNTKLIHFNYAVSIGYLFGRKRT